MDRSVITKREVLSDAEVSSCTPTTSFSNVKQKPGRQYQDTWKRTYGWLSFDVATGKAYCDVCRLAANDMNVPLPNTSGDKDGREVFVQNGFSDWEKAPFRFHSHQNSNLHRAAVQAIASVKEDLNVHSKFSEGRQKQMQDARKALLTILSSVRYLVCEGSAICSHDEEESNLKQLLLLRAEDIPQLKSWLNRTNYKWISPTIVNEMLEIMAHNVLRTLARKIKAAVYYSIIIDEITDFIAQDQVSFCFHIATEDMFVEELFFGFYETTAETVLSVLNDILGHFDLSLDRCRGQCYDGALNVAGHLSGVQALVKAEEPRALYVHCFANVVNIVVQDMSENVTMCRSFLSELSDMIAFVKTSPKCLGLSKHFQQAENINQRQFCSTRWNVRAASLQSVASNYGELIQFFENVSSEERGDPGAKADGYAQSLLRFASYFMLQLLLLVFGCLDVLDTALQKSNLQFHQAELLFASTKESTKQLQNNFEQFWSQTVMTAKDLDLESPTVPKCRKPAQCADVGCDLHQFQSPKDFYRKIFYEIIDNIHSSLDSRFSSDVFQHMSKIEKFAIGEDDSTYILNFYKTDFDAARLLLHRDMLLDIAREREIKLSALRDVIDLFSGEQGKILHDLLSELAKLIRIGLTIPVSSCTSESFLSCLCRVKTFLQSSTSLAGLNHMALLYGHKEICQEIDLNTVANEFIQRTSIRTSTFSVI